MNKNSSIKPLCTSTNLCLIIYLFINALFVYKYGLRQHYINAILLTFIFLAVYSIFIIFFSKKNLSNNFYKYSFFALAIIYTLGTIYANIKVDKYALIPDRWSAMEAGIKALFSGEYPYSALDHRHGRTSNLPTLMFMGIPFYFMNDVGYLQTFCSMLYFVLIGFYFKNYKQKFFATLLFTASFSFMYEVWIKSDIMSNFIIVMIYVFVMQMKFDKGNKLRVLLTAILSSQLLLTRLVAIIPLNILLFKKFIDLKIKQKAIFILISIIVIVINFWIVFRNVSSMQEFKEHNPFELQNSQLPFYFSIICVAIGIYFSFKNKNVNTLMNYSYLTLFLPALLAAIWESGVHGLYSAYIINSNIDVSYFDMCMPFLIFYWAMQIKNEQHVIAKVAHS